MRDPALLDLYHLGLERVVGAYLIDTPDGPALFDCGPARTIDGLRTGLAAHDLEIGDLRHLLLSHIHFDHAGAAGLLVQENPSLTVHVSEIGAPHLIDPSRLEQSARRIFLDDFDRLWGALVPIPESNISIVGDRVLDLECFPTPGHASHHVCYLRDGVLYTGDAAGVRIAPSERVMPPTPPPDLDVEAWDATLDEIGRRAPERLACIHFGIFDDVARQLTEVRERLHAHVDLVGRGATEAEFLAYAAAEVGDGNPAYDKAFPPQQDYQGLARYWSKRREAAA